MTPLLSLCFICKLLCPPNPLSAHYPRLTVISLTMEVTLPFSNSFKRVHTVVTHETFDVQRWLDGIKIEPRLTMGLGVRWRHAFGKQREFGIATLQLCMGQQCLVFQVGKADEVDAFIPGLLSNLLNNMDVKIVGI
jgi:hypothetical protein